MSLLASVGREAGGKRRPVKIAKTNRATTTGAVTPESLRGWDFQKNSNFGRKEGTFARSEREGGLEKIIGTGPGPIASAEGANVKPGTVYKVKQQVARNMGNSRGNQPKQTKTACN